MPGSSLWLLPPADHSLNSILTSLIETTSSHFHSQHLFIPHVTLTSDIPSSSYSANPQAWLSAIELPTSKEVKVIFGGLESRDVFVQKLFIKVEKAGIADIGEMARTVVPGFEDSGKARKWAEETYYPHLSLLYHDCPKVAPESISEIASYARHAGVSLAEEGDLGGWTGGRVVLVPTDKPIKDWVPIVSREL
ncbi:2',3'-cyclic-nucleotide 3'-phosphodiesteras-like protein [Clohesyomyces aquaticus]|uniref:2',3'-cyclic-nucleotide 3'-phosphodiesteras-like protein n=1 Tax=Clohesyomyces aquaticus TaxID=1231657 RepID=A0A1Y1ZZH1_9PLEO|nr:2',3'-cyclic-nucleotide 3'-phosphodiesteras-like protein [Clohesyomyces aquaticus]